MKPESSDTFDIANSKKLGEQAEKVPILDLTILGGEPVENVYDKNFYTYLESYFTERAAEVEQMRGITGLDRTDFETASNKILESVRNVREYLVTAQLGPDLDKQINTINDLLSKYASRLNAVYDPKQLPTAHEETIENTPDSAEGDAQTDTSSETSTETVAGTTDMSVENTDDQIEKVGGDAETTVESQRAIPELDMSALGGEAMQAIYNQETYQDLKNYFVQQAELVSAMRGVNGVDRSDFEQITAEIMQPIDATLADFEKASVDPETINRRINALNVLVNRYAEVLDAVRHPEKLTEAREVQYDSEEQIEAGEEITPEEGVTDKPEYPLTGEIRAYTKERTRQAKERMNKDLSSLLKGGMKNREWRGYWPLTSGISGQKYYDFRESRATNGPIKNWILDLEKNAGNIPFEPDKMTVEAYVEALYYMSADKRDNVI